MNITGIMNVLKYHLTTAGRRREVLRVSGRKNQVMGEQRPQESIEADAWMMQVLGRDRRIQALRNQSNVIKVQAVPMA
ncbi:MAG: hypothetical protein GKR94_25630 [Gammaproteobacteria bacterium]|nr:hypothetical protein [Gammaproteobacteria bacterium]